MVSESFLLNLIPHELDVYTERKCECGKHTIPVQIKYNLKIEIDTYTSIYENWSTRFKLYYRRADWCYHGDNIIGEVGGVGYRTLKEAIKVLIPYIRKVKNNERN